MESSISKAVVQFEARKIGLTHDKNGIVLKFAVHPDDFKTELLSTPLGQRYQVFVVAVDDQEEPITPKLRKETDKALAIAQSLPRNPRFQKWLQGRGEVTELGEVFAADALKRLIHVDSRAELGVREEARVLLLDLRDQFERDIKEGRA